MAPTLVFALGAAVSTAVAGHGHQGRSYHHGTRAHGYVDIDNDFAGDAQVYVNGRFMGMVAGHDDLSLTLRPGHHQVEVRRAETGFALTDQNVRVSPRRTVTVQVVPPRTRLTLKNRGSAPVRLSADCRDEWLEPGGVISLDVTAGPVPVTATLPGSPRTLRSDGPDRVGRARAAQRRGATAEDAFPPPDQPGRSPRTGSRGRGRHRHRAASGERPGAVPSSRWGQRHLRGYARTHPL